MAVLKYEEIAEFLRARIAAGEIAPGETIPSGRELAEQWDVSRATAIKAVDVLRNDGVVVAKQGTGFVVTETPVARPAGARRAGSARILGGMPFLRVGTPDWAEPPAHVAAALCLSPGTKALRRVRVLQLPDGTPNSCVEAWFPRMSRRYHRASPTPTRSPKAQRATSDVRPGEARPKAWTSPPCALASETEADRLKVPRGAPVAVLLHTAYDEQGKSLVCEEGVTPSSFFEQVDTYAM